MGLHGCLLCNRCGVRACISICLMHLTDCELLPTLLHCPQCPAGSAADPAGCKAGTKGARASPPSEYSGNFGRADFCERLTTNALSLGVVVSIVLSRWGVMQPSKRCKKNSPQDVHRGSRTGLPIAGRAHLPTRIPFNPFSPWMQDKKREEEEKKREMAALYAQTIVQPKLPPGARCG